MRNSQRRIALVVAPLFALVALLFASLPVLVQAAPPTATYEVTVTNLTGGQAFSPPVLATHRAAVRIFRVSRPASAGI